MDDHSLTLGGQTILITGGARRIGHFLSLYLAGQGANIIIHHSNSGQAAAETVAEIERMGRQAWIIQADFNDPAQTASVIEQACRFGSLTALVNSAAIFEPLTMAETTLADWQMHLNINLTAPFLLSQSFARCLPAGEKGRIVNLLDWRALRPGKDHFPYTVSKSALAAMTRSLALALAPDICVNGVALGAILPPSDAATSNGAPLSDAILKSVPAGRWAELEEVGKTISFLISGPEYITGEILHLDGGRHLV
jgi:NAD(P)-dependent dehydrogenase (short-subunit alcohol dehydrogenase family)